MASLIGLGLLLLLVYLGYRDGQRAFGRPRLRNPRLCHSDAESGADPSRRDIDAARVSDTPAAADSLAEERDVALTRQLLAGTIEASTYRRLMSDLARSGIHPRGGR